jgi:hypothetical protein
MRKKIYLATAYTGHEEKSFATANIVAAKLIKEGHFVFSPISMSHPIAGTGLMKGCWDEWKDLDLEFIRWCDEVAVINFGEEEIGPDHEISRSVGVQDELEYARSIGKKIGYIRA